MADNIRAKAQAFCQSYAKAVNCTDPTKTEVTGKAILSHYVPKGFVSFSMGSTTHMGSHNEAVPGATKYLNRWFALGIGLDVRLDNSRIEVVSPHNALCFLTWTAHPFKECGVEKWSFENVYSYRLLPGQEDGKGWFEFAISDNEIAALLQRFPDFMNMG